MQLLAPSALRAAEDLVKTNERRLYGVHMGAIYELQDYGRYRPKGLEDRRYELNFSLFISPPFSFSCSSVTSTPYGQ